MLKSIARLGAAFIAAIGFSLPASASTFSIDYSDLWGGGSPSPTENGWGLNLIQQGDVIFGTMFVYGSDNTARWFSVTLNPSGGSTTWSGVLDQTTGSFYGSPWSNASVTHTIVGTMTVSFSSASTGSLSYTASGVTVNKSISRFSLRGPNLTGHYLGGAVGTCANAAQDQVLMFDDMRVTQSGSSLSMPIRFLNSRSEEINCTFNGSLAVTGRTGSISGTYSCQGAANNNGTFTVTNLESGINGFNGNLTASDQYCTWTGRFGGVKDVIP